METQIDIEALQCEAREPSSAETSDREDDDADQRTSRGPFRSGMSAAAHKGKGKGKGKGKAYSGGLEEGRSMKKLMDSCFGSRSQWDERKVCFHISNDVFCSGVCTYRIPM